ncbi:deoxyribonuclease V [Mucilaginibacter terrae]|uniref:Endonuclease V n=1 Tax=Mucilaginibacter terrae TaxID=1955052 RepID=A0ABU3GRP2_9SPHI|nr:deoxyribonuclease V [Mucilaginibacter terrae]MDT3401632.1 deoxyribonuclease V [Mucilaginibacter terrae]
MLPADYEHLTPAQAIAVHEQMRNNVMIETLDKPINIIGGADISFNKYEETVYAGIVLFTYPELKVIGQASAIGRTSFPYIPGLLAFREVPALLDAWNKLETKPDVMVLDGQGIAHEHRMGLATHFGLLTDAPSIGSAKNRLSGRYTEPTNEPFAQSLLYDRDEVIGIALRSKKNCKPIFVSPGHKVSMAQSIDIIKTCIRGYRIPEPTRQAHNFVNQVRISHGDKGNEQLSMF